MRTDRLFALLAIVSFGLIIFGCGGGGGGGSSSAPSGAAVSQGVVTAKGSIFVNGIEYSTSNATIKIDDTPGTEADLKVGMVVKVRGVSDDATKKGTAIQVEARDLLEGTIDNNGIDAVNKTITVMGQTVRIEDNVTRLNDDDTVKTFAGAAFQVGDRVEVHGFADDLGGLRASRVVKKISGEFEMKGFVVGLGASSLGLSNTPGGTAVVTVNFSSLPAGVVAGSFVQVKSAAAPVAGAVTASLIKLEDKLGATGEKVETEGIVTSGSVASFIVNGHQVLTTSATLFEGGLASDFAVGVKLEAEGPLDANGAIVATKISFRSNIKIEANVTAFTAGSSLTLLGKTVGINGYTRTDNGPVTVGSHVEVRAYPDRDGNLVASRIVVQSASTRAFLQGPVTAFSAANGTMTLVGTAVVSDSNSQWRISTDTAQQAVTAATFFSNLTLNVTVVKVRWDNFTSTAAAIKEAEIQLGK